MNTSRCTASSTPAGSRRLAPEELQAFFALDLSDPVERARVVGASGAPHVTDGAGRGQRVVALAALRKETRSGAVGRTDAGANDEEAVVAVRNHCVVAAAALRTKTMSRAVGINEKDVCYFFHVYGRGRELMSVNRTWIQKELSQRGKNTLFDRRVA